MAVVEASWRPKHAIFHNMSYANGMEERVRVTLHAKRAVARPSGQAAAKTVGEGIEKRLDALQSVYFCVQIGGMPLIRGLNRGLSWR
jgi:hypothetical protein